MGYRTTNHRGGRPKGSVAKSTAIAIKLKEQMAVMLEKRFGPIMDAQLDAAIGIQTEHFNRMTGNLYYKEPGPNTLAFKNILEQVAGRPKESVELTGREGEPIQLDIRLTTALKKIYGEDK